MSQTEAGFDASKQLTRFHSSYSKNPDNQCWEWNLWLSPDGYGYCYFNGSKVRAHRLSYEIHFGSFPRHLLVRHMCDNPKCVNPSHLILGTQIENMVDKKVRKRAKGINKGSKNGMSKLSVSDRDSIFTHRDLGLKQHQIASLLGITQSHVSRVLSGERFNI